MDEENFDIVDPNETTGSFGKDGISYQQILLNQLARITQVLSEDMIEGHWKTLPMKTGTGAVMMHEIYISDGRKKAINSIMCYYELLLPRFDKEAKDDYKKLMEKFKDKKKKFVEDNKSDSDLTEYKLIIYRTFFQKLNMLVSRLGYFEESSSSV